jgi:hypothetical protein
VDSLRREKWRILKVLAKRIKNSLSLFYPLNGVEPIQRI